MPSTQTTTQDLFEWSALTSVDIMRVYTSTPHTWPNVQASSHLDRLRRPKLNVLLRFAEEATGINW